MALELYKSTFKELEQQVTKSKTTPFNARKAKIQQPALYLKLNE